MSLTKSFGTLLTTVLVGSVALLISSPKKVLSHKSRTVRTTKTSTQKGIEEKDNLFI